MIRIPLAYHRSTGREVDIEVDQDLDSDDPTNVVLGLHPEEGDAIVWRTLTISEARALAASLVHFAEEAER